MNPFHLAGLWRTGHLLQMLLKPLIPFYIFVFLLQDTTNPVMPIL
jgi:hypothetical protein